MGHDFVLDVDSLGVATITLDRPDALNALTVPVFTGLRDLFDAWRGDDRIRSVIVTGSGRAFCAGGDVHQVIGSLLQRDVAEHLAFTRLTGAVVRSMRMLDRPIIAAVNGVATGGGAVLALAADLRVAAESASFAFMFTRVGLSGAEMGAAYLLPRVVGMGRAAELLLLGDAIDATTAERYGLVNKVVAGDELLPCARAWAERLASGPTQAIRMTKRRLVSETHIDLFSALEAEAQAQALLMLTDDHRAYYEAFVAHEEPRFSGR